MRPTGDHPIVVARKNELGGRREKLGSSYLGIPIWTPSAAGANPMKFLIGYMIANISLNSQSCCKITTNLESTRWLSPSTVLSILSSAFIGMKFSVSLNGEKVSRVRFCGKSSLISHSEISWRTYNFLLTKPTSPQGFIHSFHASNHWEVFCYFLYCCDYDRSWNEKKQISLNDEEKGKDIHYFSWI